MADFATRNDRAAARRRYLTPRPFSDGAGFSQEDRQQLRWQYPGLLVGAFQAPVLRNIVGVQIAAPNVVGVGLAAPNIVGREPV